MKTFLSTLGLIFIASLGYSQELSKEFGKITMEDFNYTPKDKKAEAVTLFDIGKVTFEQDSDGGFNIKYVRTKRVKILKEEGIDQANIAIPLYYGKNDHETLSKVEAYVYSSVDGIFQKSEFDKKQIYDEKKNDNVILKKFTLPQVTVGSVIEYKYIMYSPFYFQLPEWSFQSEIPTLYSEFEVRMVPYYEYYFTAQNIRKLSSQTSKVLVGEHSYFGNKYKEYQHRYIMKNVAAFRDESYITSKEDYLMKINFQIAKIFTQRGGTIEYVSTWEKLNADLQKAEFFGRYMAKAKKVGEEIIEQNPQLVEGDQVQVTKNLITYVKNNFTWNEYYGKKARQKVKQLIEKKTGSVADINLFMIGLLRAANIDANPVIISTRGNGKINSDYPFQHYFNYVIANVKLDKGEIMADASTPLLGFNELPLRCINDKGMLLKDKEEVWLNVYNYMKSHDKTELKITFNEDLSTSKVSIMKSLKGMSAYISKANYSDNKEALKEYFEDQGLKGVEEVKSRGFSSPNKTYFIAAKGENPTEQLMDKVIVKPFYQFPFEKNPFTEKERTYAIDMVYKSLIGYTISIAIPEGYTITKLPSRVSINNNIIQMECNTIRNENLVTLNYSYQFKKAKYESSEYSQLKEIFNTLVRKFNVELVLEPLEN